MKPDVLTALRTASQGLLYPSETDAPFEAFSWGKADGDLTPQKVARLAKAAAGTTVEDQSAADFFQFLIDNGGDHADAFRKLQQVVSQQLSGVRVFRVGEVNIDVYVVGRTAGGEWAGLKTHSVET